MDTIAATDGEEPYDSLAAAGVASALIKVRIIAIPPARHLSCCCFMRGHHTREQHISTVNTGRFIKNFVDPEELELRLRRLGWDCTIRPDDIRWVYGEAHLVS